MTFETAVTGCVADKEADNGRPLSGGSLSEVGGEDVAARRDRRCVGRGGRDQGVVQRARHQGLVSLNHEIGGRVSTLMKGRRSVPACSPKVLRGRCQSRSVFGSAGLRLRWMSTARGLRWMLYHGRDAKEEGSRGGGRVFVLAVPEKRVAREFPHVALVWGLAGTRLDGRNARRGFPSRTCPCTSNVRSSSHLCVVAIALVLTSLLPQP